MLTPRRILAAHLASAFLLIGQKPDLGHEAALDLQGGKYTEASQLLQRALKLSPRDARLWTFNGLTQIQLHDSTGALQSFHRALRLSPDYVPALEGAAQLEFQTGSPQAIPLLNKLLQLRPRDSSAHAMLADIAFKQGECKSAKDHYLQSLPDGNAEVDGLRELGACLINQKRIQDALPVFKRLSLLTPDSQQASYSFAVVQFLAGKYADVIQTLTPATQPDAATLELLAEANEYTGSTTNAFALLKQAIAASPQVQDYYADFAYLALAHGRFQEGIDVLNEGLKLLPGAAPLYVAKGLLHSELGEFFVGESDFQTASRLDPNVELGSAAQSLAELQQNDLPRAEQNIRARLRLHPNDAFQHYLLAEVLTKKGADPHSPGFQEALRSAETAVKLKPNLLLGRNALARLYLQAGRIDESIEQSRAVFRANPTDQTALYHLILALRKSDRTQELPPLLSQLARLKEQSRKQDDIDHHYQSLVPAR